MPIIPAIDLRGGQCVRLYQGDFAQEEVYATDPVTVAMQWAAQGATIIHVVDLDGAKAGQPMQLAAVNRLRQALPASVRLELGGGLRQLADLHAAFDAGVDRVVLGTAAVAQPALLGQAVREYGSERIILGLDARDGYVATDGWLTTSTVLATDLAAQVGAQGISQVIYTDISRDGTLTEPNYAAISDLIASSGLRVIASGGVANYAQLQRLAALGCAAAIVGKALYSGDLLLTSFMVAAEGQQLGQNRDNQPGGAIPRSGSGRSEHGQSQRQQYA